MIIIQMVRANGQIITSKEFMYEKDALAVVTQWKKVMGTTYRYFINNVELAQ